jgi:ABC-type sugar transport system substrate-binding protein
MQKKTMLRAAALAVTLTAAPLAFSPADGVTTNTACAQKTPGTGTCCFQRNSICVTPTQNIANAYFKSEGMC